MAEKHKIYGPGGIPNWGDFVYSIWDFVHNQQTGILQFVDDGGTKSVYLGAAFWDGVTALTAASFTDGSYVVVEPVNAYPGTGKWQVKLLASDVSTYTATTAKMSVKMSFSGGWNSTTNTDFASVSTAVTAALQVVQTSMGTGDSFYFSCSNLDTYTNSAGSQTYTYARFLVFDSSESENEKFVGVYAGGYIPAELDNDDKPSVLMTRMVSSYALVPTPAFPATLPTLAVVVLMVVFREQGKVLDTRITVIPGVVTGLIRPHFY